MTQLGQIPHPYPAERAGIQPTLMLCKRLLDNRLRDRNGVMKISARPLHLSGRRRVIQRSGWVVTPNVSRAQSAPLQPLEESTMKWTKPEAEVVAVTMEVTAYVATL